MLVQLTGPLPWAIEIVKRQAPSLSGKMKMGCTVHSQCIRSHRFKQVSCFRLCPCKYSELYKASVLHKPSKYIHVLKVCPLSKRCRLWLDKWAEFFSSVFSASRVHTMLHWEPRPQTCPHEQCGCPHSGGPHCLLQPSPNLNSARKLEVGSRKPTTENGVLETEKATKHIELAPSKYVPILSPL